MKRKWVLIAAFGAVLCLGAFLAISEVEHDLFNGGQDSIGVGAVDGLDYYDGAKAKINHDTNAGGNKILDVNRANVLRPNGVKTIPEKGINENLRKGNTRPDTEEPSESEGQKNQKSDGNGISVEEKQVLVMYEDMAAAFEKYENDCEAMGEAVAAAVRNHSQAVENLKSSRAELDPSQVALSKRRLEDSHGERMTYLRDQIKKGVTNCRSDERLLAALRQLAKMNDPGGGGSK